MKILTFDIEEWMFYVHRFMGDVASADRLLGRLLDMLDERGLRATFFCLGIIAREFPEVIRRIEERGHEIGCHSDKHNWLLEFSRPELMEDTRRAIDSLEQVTGKKIKYYRAPAFSIGEKNVWAIEVLANCGIEVDCSIFPATRDFGGFASFSQDTPTVIEYNGSSLKELPIGITSVFGYKLAYSGGGYFRLLPYGFIRKTMNSRKYDMVYMHISDFDAERPRKLNMRYFKNYYGLKGTMGKMEKMVADFDFLSVGQAHDQIDWDKCNRIIL